MFRLSSASIAALCTILLVGGAPDAAAQALVEVGTLTCTGGEGIGLIIGSQKSYACSFTPASGRPGEHYSATVTKIGIDVGVTGKTTIVWTVFAASQPKHRHALAGVYAGVSADASLGLGAGAKVLVGGSEKSITLQPVSVQGQTGVNLAVGVAGMSLQ